MNLCLRHLLGHLVISLSLYALPDFDHRNIVCLIAHFGILMSNLARLILVAELKDVLVCVGAGDVAVLAGIEDLYAWLMLFVFLIFNLYITNFVCWNLIKFLVVDYGPSGANGVYYYIILIIAVSIFYVV